MAPARRDSPSPWERTGGGSASSPWPSCMPVAGRSERFRPAGVPTSSCGRAAWMPQQCTRYNRTRRDLLDDFPERLRRFKEASGLSWAEIARRLGTTPKTVRRWYQGKGRPNAYYLLALQDLAKGLGLGHMLTAQEGRGDTRPGTADRPRCGKEDEGGTCRRSDCPGETKCNEKGPDTLTEGR